MRADTGGPFSAEERAAAGNWAPHLVSVSLTLKGGLALLAGACAKATIGLDEYGGVAGHMNAWAAACAQNAFWIYQV